MSTQFAAIKDANPSHSATTLSTEQIHRVLGNSRRREVIDLLQSNGDRMAVRDLAERIAELESGEAPPPRNKRHSAYVSLMQTHLPKLDELGIVDYDSQSKHVQLRDLVHEVNDYMEDGPTRSDFRHGLLFGLGVTGLLLVVGSDIGLPLVGSVPPQYWAYGVLAVVILITGLQTYHQPLARGNR